MNQAVLINEEGRIYIIDTDTFLQIPPDEPSLWFDDAVIDGDKITMNVIAKMPTFLMKEVRADE